MGIFVQGAYMQIPAWRSCPSISKWRKAFTERKKLEEWSK
ncbi:hypothetical protein HMPREF9104_00405 [Lentilactobacillus kisonensis F0435]|uniref:Uncharacterized protein n=1 Tax=Lentilactobacillus kisonensis F0435 TaxID=797516 RepID=H1LCU1_9LACO|nr:hypothetical protein HMPREF9104_00405 [Lentilactobacillus kisonensis F0435]